MVPRISPALIPFLRCCGLKSLPLPTSFWPFVKDFYSFTHAHQRAPSAPDSLPARHAVVFARQKSSQSGDGDQNTAVSPAPVGRFKLGAQNLQCVHTKALGLHGLVRPVARQPL